MDNSIKDFFKTIREEELNAIVKRIACVRLDPTDLPKGISISDVGKGSKSLASTAISIGRKDDVSIHLNELVAKYQTRCLLRKRLSKFINKELFIANSL